MEDDKRLITFGQSRLIHDDIEAVREVLVSGRLRQGRIVAETERALAEYCGVEDCVLVSSCTSALYLCFKYFNVDEKQVIMPSFTFGAVAAAVVSAGGIPRFVDSKPDLPVISLKSLTDHCKPVIGAIVAVHQFGIAADADRISTIAAQANVPFIEDCAYGIGTFVGKGHAGSFGKAGCMSFGILKPITCGEGGAILCSQRKLAQEFRIMREYGMQRWKNGKAFLREGGNFKLTEFQSALLLSQICRKDEILNRKKWLRNSYEQELCSVSGIKIIPKNDCDTNSAFVVIDVEGTGVGAIHLADRLRENGVEVETYTPLHREPYFEKFAHKCGDVFPNSEALARHLIALPSHQGITETDIRIICRRISVIIDEAGSRERMAKKAESLVTHAV